MAPGTYSVRVLLSAGWTQVTPAGNAGYSVTIAADTRAADRDFTLFAPQASITVQNTKSLNIADNLKPTTSTLVVSDSRKILDLNVKLNITHARDSDLDVYLIAPDGTRIELTTDNGGEGDNYTNTIFSDEAPTSITAGVAPFTGAFRPETPLIVLDGKSFAGTWKLEITDDTVGTKGTLKSWYLTAILDNASSPSALMMAPTTSQSQRPSSSSLKARDTVFAAELDFTAKTDMPSAVEPQPIEFLKRTASAQTIRQDRVSLDIESFDTLEDSIASLMAPTT